METSDRNAPIVVGIDREPDSADALVWAIDEAEATQRPLRLVHAYEWLVDQPPFFHPVGNNRLDVVSRVDFEQRGRRIAEDAEVFVRAMSSRLPVTTHVVEGTPSRVLTEEGRQASALVLGSHARGFAGRVLMGSVSSAVVSRPPCPVTVVRAVIDPESRDDATRPIVVGVDGSPSSRAALRFAVGHAAAHKRRLVLVHSWHKLSRRSAGTAHEQLDVRDNWLHGVVDHIRQEHPALDIVRAVASEAPAATLVDWSRRARLVVVGASEHHSHIGSVTQALLHHAWSPVTVVPAPFGR
ncbi:universal stress protein [Phytomonospora sp. NPDC050363]|uniref:universal stress protein n=1 Tax=Phytomonospora sp. NPDC050363 TaxID=3155642 RepID=UPI0033FE6F52